MLTIWITINPIDLYYLIIIDLAEIKLDLGL